ncbi:MAG: hypothetical protein Q8O57_13215, partial [Kiritimatiellota bacterium]|nr:hypothetical protein [Kiritimatiellota bacterium]
AAFLEKPISAKRLLDTVRDVLSQGGSDEWTGYEGVPKWRDARSRPTTATVGPQLAEAIISLPT